MKINVLPSSFRDPSGFVFSLNGEIYRQINKTYEVNYRQLIESGLYDKLSSLGYLIPHKEVTLAGTNSDAYKIIKPQPIPFISYPYEWCFSMLKNAALLTLTIQKISLQYGMSLKDASAFNVQFLDGRPILIDTLSFESYKEGLPWIAYKQFVEHFLAPLTLMTFTDIRLGRLSTLFFDGIPLDLVAKILPLSARFKPSLLLHIYAHSTSQKKFSQKRLIPSKLEHRVSKEAFLGLLGNLEGVIKSLQWNYTKTQWTNYYEGNNNYKEKSFRQKEMLVRKFLKSIRPRPRLVWDLGANTGLFSRIAREDNALVISWDEDMGVLERNYLQIEEGQEKNILPLFCDLTNPSPALGWANQERLSLVQRGPVDVVLALALIHHLAIAQNISLDKIASFFSQITEFLIVEFIPKEDSQVKKLLMNREDIFQEYTQENFEKVFKKFFQVEEIYSLAGSQRVLYLMKKKGI